MALGRGLDMTVVAEGAESPEDLELLKSIGCDCVQGYVFARPCPPADAVALAREREPGGASTRVPPALGV